MILIAFPFALRASPAKLPGHDVPAAVGYLYLLRNARYMRMALCHALGFGALLTFVASAPQLFWQAFKLGPGSFAFAQAIGVGTFILLASQAGRVSDRIGVSRAIKWGAWLHVVLCTAFLVAAAAGVVTFYGTLVFWSGFCGVLAIRGPAAFSEALAVPAPQMGRASALLVLALLAAGAAGTQLAAIFLATAGLTAVASVMVGLTLASAALVTSYSRHTVECP